MKFRIEHKHGKLIRHYRGICYDYRIEKLANGYYVGGEVDVIVNEKPMCFRYHRVIVTANLKNAIAKIERNERLAARTFGSDKPFPRRKESANDTAT